MKHFTQVTFVCAALLASVSASANDSTARKGVGGIELTKTDSIQMVSETLEISTARIRVKYRFLNTSTQDIKTIVAFPMPAFDVMGIVGSGGKQSPLDSFRSFVDGQPVQIKKNRAYLIGKVDMTDKLRKIGLSDEQIFDPQFSCTEYAGDDELIPGCDLTKNQVAAIRKQNLLGGAIQETAYWEQTFPAGKEIEVAHEYKPFTGHGASNWLHFNNYRDAKKQLAEVCLDEGTYRLMKPVSDYPDEEWDGSIGVYYLDVEYILGTGRNWKGSIKNFKLVLQKRSPEDVVSLCFPGKPKKTSPITIEFSQTDFVPQDKLVIYFFQRHTEVPR